jgi:microcystin degradation protein MlrC/catechol 2,3-dioxygenase-like lactoylglutathione lyase family enzyme
MRIAIAGFSDETCTFCKEPTTVDRFEPATRRGEKILDAHREMPTYINGYLQVLESEGVEVVPLVDAVKTPGGFSSWLTTDCFDKYANEIADRIKAAKTLDGVLLSLHGALAVTGVPRPEAEIVRRARVAAGNIPIMVTLDLHANEDEELCKVADGVFVLKTYPHVDLVETGMIAAKCMVRTVRGEFVPTMACRRPGILSASIYQASDCHPMKDIYDRCREWEAKPRVYCVSVAPGYAYADVVDAGMSVFVVTDNDQALAERIAQDVSDFAWSLKESFTSPLPGAKEATELAIGMVAQGKRPVIIADGADRIGDSTHMLKELLRHPIGNWAIPGITDPKIAKELEDTAKAGDTVTVTVGGWYDEFSGTPAEITGRVEYIGYPTYRLVGPMGKGARVRESLVVSLDLGNNRHVVISEKMRGANDSTGFTALDIDYTTLDIIVLKDRVHHRAFWDSVAKATIRTSVPGQGPADLSLLSYQNVPEDLYPVGAKWRVPISFGHVGLVVQDIERSISFYRDVLGLKLFQRYPDTGRGVEVAFLGDPVCGSALELLCYRDMAERSGEGRYDHVAWYVPDIKSKMKNLKSRGIHFREGDPVRVLDGRLIAFCYGPDGERIELVQKPPSETRT